MIQRIKLKFGSGEGQSSLEYRPGPVTIFVGPNNSGKSLILKELMHFYDIDSSHNAIVSTLKLRPFVRAELKELLMSLRRANDSENSDYIYAPISGSNFRAGVDSTFLNIEKYISSIDAKGNLTNEAGLYALLKLQLDGQTRLHLATEQALGNLSSRPNNLLSALFTDDTARSRLRELLYEAFGLYLTLHPTNFPNLQIRYQSKPIPDDIKERSLDDDAIRYFNQGTSLQEMSDGVKAYTGILATMVSWGYRIIAIDEPEAFLHPPLVRKLGRRLTQLAWEREGNVFASTHSSDFLLGCIQANPKVNVIRLTYKQGIPTARQLSAEKLEEMMRNPLLRSTGVLSGLFHEGAIVCEADSDRAFYQEINERLLEAKEGGVDSCLFLNVNGKDQLRYVIQPLREMGIPAAAVVDLDVIKKGTLTLLLQAAFVPPILVENLRTLKDRINSKYEELGLDPKRVGLLALDSPTKQAAEDFIQRLEEYGIFVVPVGELEGWLKELNATAHAPYWLTQVFEKMGSDPADAEYVKPRSDDVWDFMKGVAKWISNPLRKGIPQ